MSVRVIAIDGPSYVGKSSVSKALAGLTGFTYINTGHMYRAVAKRCWEQGIEPADEASVIAVAKKTRIEFKSVGADSLTWVDGEDWTQALDAPETVLMASKIAKLAALREILTSLQRAYARERMIIMEGRDIGSQVFPDAAWKFFITASLEVRAKRMLKMMDAETRKAVTDAALLIPQIKELDENDMKRAIAPLTMAEDAILYDNSDSPTAEQDAGVLNGYLTGKAKVKI